MYIIYTVYSDVDNRCMQTLIKHNIEIDLRRNCEFELKVKLKNSIYKQSNGVKNIVIEEICNW